MRNAASAAKIAPFAPVSVRDVCPVVRLYIFCRRELGVPCKLEGLDVFVVLILNLSLHLLILKRRHAPRPDPVKATGTGCTR